MKDIFTSSDELIEKLRYYSYEEKEFSYGDIIIGELKGRLEVFKAWRDKIFADTGGDGFSEADGNMDDYEDWKKLSSQIKKIKEVLPNEPFN